MFCCQTIKMATATEAPESWYLALLGFAEHFRTSSPPKIRLCVHCLKAVFQFKPTQRIEARTHLQLGSVLYQHTKNIELARTHLEKAVRRSADQRKLDKTLPHHCPLRTESMSIAQAKTDICQTYYHGVDSAKTTVISFFFFLNII